MDSAQVQRITHVIAHMGVWLTEGERDDRRSVRLSDTPVDYQGRRDLKGGPMMNSFLSRSRWAAVGAAVAVTLGGGGVLYSFAASGAPSSFTAITPVRVLDTRSGVGAPAAPLGANKVLAVPIAGANGVPANASAVVLNVTVVDGSTQSYLTVYPQGGTRRGCPA